MAIGATGIGFASTDRVWSIPTDAPLNELAKADERWSPRWVWWGRETSGRVAAGPVAVDRCWDVLAVHRLLSSDWRASPGKAWAWLHDLPTESLPTMGQLGLLDAAVDEGDTDDPVRPDGHLRPEWTSGGWDRSADHLGRWANVALKAVALQRDRLAQLPDPSRAEATARAESAAELLCAEMAHEGLPVNAQVALRLIGDAAGPRPTSEADEIDIRAARDQVVFAHLIPGQKVNLRNPADVKSMFHQAGFDLPDTKAWRLAQLRDSSPLADAFLTWRKAERIASTYGYAWFDDHVAGGRLRGDWASSDGAAGRMTASAGLHNLPATMRPMVEAGPDRVFVRADLGQVEPRVLAAVSGDADLADACKGDDLYQPIADRLGVSREIAKVAVLGAMYGATTGESAHALAGLKKNYPVAMGLLEDAAEAGQAGSDVFTVGGRRIVMWTDPAAAGDIDRARSAAASRGRYARNALVQGAAAELFKLWAITVRRRIRPLGASVVLCLHDELLVHCSAANATDVANMVDGSLQEAAHYWMPDHASPVRFLADISQVRRWSEAK